MATIACQVAVVALLTSGVRAQYGDAGVLESPRATNASLAASKLLHDWFGPLPGPASAMPVRVRWLAPVRDQSLERAVIGRVARQYWAAPSPASEGFRESLVIYTATRAVHHLLEGSNFATPRFFGGLVPFPLRSVLLSPPVNDPRPRVLGFEELEMPGAPDHQQGVRALQSLERYVGWPTMLDALSRLRAGDPSRWDVAVFGEVLSEVRGTDVRALVHECFSTDAVFDYALGDLQSRALASGQFETTITIARRGSGRFALQEEGDDREAALPVLVRFADGREIREAIDGAAASATLVFTAPTPAVRAAVDPDVMLVLDVDRENNASRDESRISKLGVRLALHWLAWLQNAMLSYTALV